MGGVETLRKRRMRLRTCADDAIGCSSSSPDRNRTPSDEAAIFDTAAPATHFDAYLRRSGRLQAWFLSHHFLKHSIGVRMLFQPTGGGFMTLGKVQKLHASTVLSKNAH